MNTEIKTHVARDARSQSSTSERPSGEAMGKAVPPLNRTPVKRLDTSEEIACMLQIARTCSNRTLRGVAVVLTALVAMCLVMAAIVWWRLLT